MAIRAPDGANNELQSEKEKSCARFQKIVRWSSKAELLPEELCLGEKKSGVKYTLFAF